MASSSSGLNGWNRKTLGIAIAILAAIGLFQVVGFLLTIVILGGLGLVIAATKGLKWLNDEDGTSDEDDGDEDESDDETPEDESAKHSGTNKSASKAGTGLAQALGLTEDESDEFIAAYQAFLSNPRPLIGLCQTFSYEQMQILVGHYNRLFARLGLTVDFRDDITQATRRPTPGPFPAPIITATPYGQPGSYSGAPGYGYPQYTSQQPTDTRDYCRVEPAPQVQNPYQQPSSDEQHGSYGYPAPTTSSPYLEPAPEDTGTDTNAGLGILRPREIQLDLTDGEHGTQHMPALPPQDDNAPQDGTQQQAQQPPQQRGRFPGRTFTIAGEKFHLGGSQQPSSDE